MPARLAQIIAATRSRVAESKRNADVRALERAAASHVPRGFRKALKTATGSGPAIIAELKKASPSRGLIRQNFDAEELARALETAGAAALSVLTDEEFFQGSLENLRRAAAASRLPCLRKDFMVDEFQILEARASCADAVLLIVAALSSAELATLGALARDFGLDVLCEVHSGDELQQAVDAGFDLIGVNNRDLRTFKVNIETAVRLAPLIPKNTVRVAESGIHNGEGVTCLRAAGYDAFLIGESLMREVFPGEALRKLLAEAAAHDMERPVPSQTRL